MNSTQAWEKNPAVFWDGSEVHNPSCSPACRCSSTLQTSLRFPFWTNRNNKHNVPLRCPVPLCPGPARVAPFPTVHCQTRGKPRLLSSISFFASFSLSFSLFQFQSLSLSLACIRPHSCCIMFHAIGITFKYLIIACFFSVTVSIPVFFFCDICLYRYVVTEKKDSFLLRGY